MQLLFRGATKSIVCASVPSQHEQSSAAVQFGCHWRRPATPQTGQAALGQPSQSLQLDPIFIFVVVPGGTITYS